MGNPLRVCTRAGTLFALSLAIISPAHGGGGYLSRTGPPPLRFAVPANQGHLALPPVSSGNSDKNPDNPGTQLPSPSSPASPQPGEILSAPPALTNAPVLPTAVGFPAESVDPVNSGSPASDLLTVTPQMLVDYFTPALKGTNHSQTAVLVPAAVGFTPPMPKNPASSQAIYISK